MKVVLIGWPIGHSISPAIQNAAFKAFGFAGDYSLLPVEREADLSEAIAGLKADLNWMGANVTVPYKEKIIPLLQGLEGAAARLKAVNTILRWGDKLIGHNTDMPAFLADLDRNGMEFRGRPALVIGSGGAARAVVRGLVESRCQVSLVAVIREQAEALARELGDGLVDVLAWDDPALRDRARMAGLVVNTSPVGMWPKVDDSPWPDTVPFPEKAYVYDLVYNPAETRFLREAGGRGLKTAGGLGMLVEQAAQSFKIWTGADAPREVMMQAAKKALSEREGK
jgi:shikimate dehydrogenase